MNFSREEHLSLFRTQGPALRSALPMIFICYSYLLFFISSLFFFLFSNQLWSEINWEVISQEAEPGI